MGYLLTIWSSISPVTNLQCLVLNCICLKYHIFVVAHVKFLFCSLVTSTSSVNRIDALCKFNLFHYFHYLKCYKKKGIRGTLITGVLYFSIWSTMSIINLQNQLLFILSRMQIMNLSHWGNSWIVVGYLISWFQGVLP